MARDGAGQGARCGSGWAAEGRGGREESRDADGQGHVMSPPGHSFSNSNLCRNHTGKLLKSWFWFTTFEAGSEIVDL